MGMTTTGSNAAKPALSLPPILTPESVLEYGQQVRLLDVRSPAEFASAHVAGSYNVPLDMLPEHATEIRSHVGRPIILVCQSGARATKAADLLRTAGITTMAVMDGGVNRWLAEGRPAVKGAPRMSIERQVRIIAGGLAAIGGFLALFVDVRFAALSAFVGSGLVFAGVTDSCMMGLLIAKAPWNRTATCDAAAVVRTLIEES
jgi:rhodanese-related sulfurtransferase